VVCATGSVVPDYPHHVTQRGVRRMDVFFSDEDRTTYLDLLAKQGGRYGIQFLAWCLMTNHVHLIVVFLHVCLRSLSLSFDVL